MIFFVLGGIFIVGGLIYVYRLDLENTREQIKLKPKVDAIIRDAEKNEFNFSAN